MATRMLQRRGTAAEWSSQNPILSDGEIGVETDTGRVKVGNGVDNWSDLTMAWLPVSGGTMTGALLLSTAPTVDAHAVRKQDLDAAVSNLGLRETVKITASGTFVKGNYSWLRALRVRVVGGGGGGGGCDGTGANSASEGGGAGGGGYAEGFFTVAQLPTSVSVTIGAGGTVTVAGPGNAGGDTSFGTLAVATGGAGGGIVSATTGSGQASGGISGIGTAGDILGSGDAGGSGIVRSTIPGFDNYGGGSIFGGGGRTAHAFFAEGDNAKAWGGGGSGARNNPGNGNNRQGGLGYQGIVLLDLFA